MIWRWSVRSVFHINTLHFCFISFDLKCKICHTSSLGTISFLNKLILPNCFLFGCTSHRWGNFEKFCVWETWWKQCYFIHTHALIHTLIHPCTYAPYTNIIVNMLTFFPLKWIMCLYFYKYSHLRFMIYILWHWGHNFGCLVDRHQA